LWVWNPEFDNYDGFDTYNLPPNAYFNAYKLAVIWSGSLNTGYNDDDKLQIPTPLLDRLNELRILDILRQTRNIANGELPEPIKEGLPNNVTSTWVFPRVVFMSWLGYRSLSEPCPGRDFGCYIVNIGGSEKWKGQIVFMIRWLDWAL